MVYYMLTNVQYCRIVPGFFGHFFRHKECLPFIRYVIFYFQHSFYYAISFLLMAIFTIGFTMSLFVTPYVWKVVELIINFVFELTSVVYRAYLAGQYGEAKLEEENGINNSNSMRQIGMCDESYRRNLVGRIRTERRKFQNNKNLDISTSFDDESLTDDETNKTEKDVLALTVPLNMRDLRKSVNSNRKLILTIPIRLTIHNMNQSGLDEEITSELTDDIRLEFEENDDDTRNKEDSGTKATNRAIAGSNLSSRPTLPLRSQSSQEDTLRDQISDFSLTSENVSGDNIKRDLSPNNETDTNHSNVCIGCLASTDSLESKGTQKEDSACPGCRRHIRYDKESFKS
ncbi:hypothetical protein SNEBB_000038 [Seison nebaliae]|nr:hypothetical protein SNEBB_000038 [Seison nebaliae]